MSAGRDSGHPGRRVTTSPAIGLPGVLKFKKSRTRPIAVSAPHPRATYEVADFATLDAEAAAELHRRADADYANGLVDCAHLVVTCDRRTGLVQHHLPCLNGRDAIALAARVVAERRALDPRPAFSVTVTPLLPH